ncbi:PROBABLE CONSERVED INTEGRAL MEMBRANE ALANINE AND VALINE AND LEUCINE RICH PROTEIN [Micrococcus lylae]|uniref:PROBABLE CONSERVED INTEGRAL MEMBRANE ALANINE AND VALINE AND LEUCINE RICH PROTEIN n=1 Tax=Micrococcus lylae TaxID=1273 RepID=A0A1R4J0S3_9MICC|nr:PROBABLE CONSERVED INTEGRAL MEMBRANE ALANINE AND VALINE AND LEUCINE RICH PROTEIN [Micrococcus lylae]
MSDVTTVLSSLRRLLVGRPVASGPGQRTVLPRTTALPVHSSNAFSSLAYAPDEVILTLVTAGAAGLTLGPVVGIAVVAIMLLIVLAFRAAVVAVPRGGIYEMARTNLGPRSGVVASSALLVDLVFTVAVSLAAFAQYAVALFPVFRGHRLPVALAALLLLVLVCLRGAGRGRRMTAVLVSVFVVLLTATIAVGVVQDLTGGLARAQSAGYTVVDTVAAPATALGVGLLALRAFAAGSALLTGVEAPVGAVEQVRRPSVPGVRWILLCMAGTMAALTLGVMHLAQRTGVVVALDHDLLRTPGGNPVPDELTPPPVVAQIAAAVFGGQAPWTTLVVASVAVLLLIAARAAFASFPALTARLAEGGYLPRHFKSRGDRLVQSWSVICLGIGAAVLLLVFEANTAYLVQVYVIGVFLAFSLALAGMLRLWRRRLAHTPGSRGRALVRLRLVLTAAALGVTVLAGLVVFVTRFASGAWVALPAILLGALLMGRIHAHYGAVAAELAPAEDDDARALPSRVHATVVVTSLNRPTLRALAYARASRPGSLEAVVVDIEREQTAALLAEWERAAVPVPLTVVGSPYRDGVTPLVRHLRRLSGRRSRGLTMVYLPEYVVRPGWRTLLHNRAASRLRSRLQREPGVMIALVPWQVQDGLRAGDLGANSR